MNLAFTSFNWKVFKSSIKLLFFLLFILITAQTVVHASIGDIVSKPILINNDTWHDTLPGKGAVKVKITPARKKGLFNGNRIRYKIHILNTYDEAEEGTVTFKVFTDKNKLVTGGTYEIKVPANTSVNIRPKFKVKEPGWYDIITSVNLSDYDDTIKKVFGYKPTKMNTPVHKPADFDKFWAKAIADLKEVQPKYVIRYSEKQSTPTHKLYNIDMQSLENITIHAWLSVPRLPGKFSVLMAIPGYKQKTPPFFPDDQAIFCLAVRTTDQMYGAGLNPKNEEEFCMINIDDKNQYVYRGVYMDCIRGLDFIFSHSNLGLDTTKVIVSGGSQGGLYL